MVWIFVFGGTLVFMTLIKYLTPRYLTFLLDRMAYRPQREIEYVLENEEPPERWRGGYNRKMNSLIKYMRRSRWVDESDERRIEIIGELKQIREQWAEERARR